MSLCLLITLALHLGGHGQRTSSHSPGQSNQQRSAARRGAARPSDTARRPNILLITTDEQRTSTLNCYGNSFAHSPNLDRLAAGGVRFMDAHTVCPACSPARTSLLTGVHVPVHGVYENSITTMRSNLTPYFDQLKKAGYHTALIGKTHFRPYPTSIDYLDQQQGMRGPQVRANKFLETYLVNSTVKWILSVMHGNQPRKPWFVHLSGLSPHGPIDVPAGPWDHVYDGVKLPALSFRPGEIARLPHQTRMILGLLGHEEDNPPFFPNGTPDMHVIDRPVVIGNARPIWLGRYNYYTLAAYVDHQVGRMLDFLKNKDLEQNTLVIFTTDHGSMLYDHGIGQDKHSFYDQSLRIPLIMRLPRVLPSNETRKFASTLDITVTILKAAGAEIPPDYQGFDLLSPLSRREPSPRTVVVSTDYRAFSVVTPSWKLEYFVENKEGRLWNRRRDPDEHDNLFESMNPHVGAARDGLLRALLRWRAQQDPLGYLVARSCEWRVGPAGERVCDHTKKIHGLDAETNLQNEALKFEDLA